MRAAYPGANILGGEGEAGINHFEQNGRVCLLYYGYYKLLARKRVLLLNHEIGYFYAADALILCPPSSGLGLDVSQKIS